ncbi:hypothetical protein [uncultured Jatrophihabitans sp.]|uniref:hypothetical protein n=1 Tax=uncultured Jatrophihabitans sp. TaxID=1610747 RepID=UPI0035C9EFB3
MASQIDASRTGKRIDSIGDDDVVREDREPRLGQAGHHRALTGGTRTDDAEGLPAHCERCGMEGLTTCPSIEGDCGRGQVGMREQVRIEWWSDEVSRTGAALKDPLVLCACRLDRTVSVEAM